MFDQYAHFFRFFFLQFASVGWAGRTLPVEAMDIFFIGLFLGLIIAFFVLSVLSKIRPFILCSFWFLGLLLLYTWRCGYFILLFPSLAESPFKGIYFFVLQSIPVIIYLFITKAVTILQTKNYPLFQRIFTVFLYLSVGYLGLIIFMSLLHVDLLIFYFKVVQGVFLVFLMLLGIPSLAWLILSLRKNLNFYKFQASFGLLFIIALLGKFVLNPTDFSSAFLEPTLLMVGIGGQLLYMFWLLMASIFEDQIIQDDENNLDSHQDKLIEAVGVNVVNNILLVDLSPREMDIFKAYCNGFSYSEISSAFLISPNTVKSHLKSCYRKLKINSKVEAISIMNKSKGVNNVP